MLTFIFDNVNEGGYEALVFADGGHDLHPSLDGLEWVRDAVKQPGEGTAQKHLPRTYNRKYDKNMNNFWLQKSTENE